MAFQPDQPSEQYLDHHGRLLEGMAAAVRERGLRGSTVADVVRIARVSRRTFYQHFDDLIDCYLELMRCSATQLLEAVREAIESGGTAEERIDRAVGRYLDLLEEDPALARSYWLEYHLTGERGRGSARLRQRARRRALRPDSAQELRAAARRRASRCRRAALVMLAGGIRELEPAPVRARPPAARGPGGDRVDGAARRYGRPSRSSPGAQGPLGQRHDLVVVRRRDAGEEVEDVRVRPHEDARLALLDALGG